MYSFDVFDTLITRITAVPCGIFAVMQEILKEQKYAGIPESIRRNFFRLRVESEKLARYTYQDGQTDDVTLQQIYEAIAMRGELDENQIKQLMDLECDTEYQACVPVSSNIRWIKELMQKGEEVVLISDMYLPKAIIKKMLKKADPALTKLRLFLSNEYGMGKYTGRLYQKVKQEINPGEQEWIHVGDNQRVDGIAAQKTGIHTDLSWFPALLPLERALLERSPDNYWLHLRIGCSRLARLSLGQKEIKKDGVETGICTGGILLTSYAGWILKCCREKGINRLYFIARDGYILKQIADEIISSMGLDIKTHYLYGSRRAWRMASFSSRNHDIQKLWNWSHGGSVKSIRDIAEIFQIQTDELRKFISLEIQDDTMKLSYFTIQKIWKKLQENEAFIDFLVQYHSEKRRVVKQYLMQEMDFSDRHFAFVDVSGSGYTQSCLADIIYDFYREPVVTFFFKLDKINVADNCRNYCFYPTRIENGVILEMFCRAPEEQTVGYRNIDGSIVPVFSENEAEKQAIVEHGFFDYLKGIMAFVKQFCGLGQDVFSTDTEQLAELLNYITQARDKVLLRFLGDMPNSVTGREKEVIPFAPVLTEMQIRQIYLEGRTEVYPNTCLQYSLLRCSPQALHKIEKYKARALSAGSLTVFFPYELCCGKIVLYGAGKMGQELYENMLCFKQVQIVQWIDKRKEKCGNWNGQIEGIEDLGKKEYDKLIIAVYNYKTALDIKDELLKRKIPEEKLVWFDPGKEWAQNIVKEGKWHVRKI